VGLSAGDSTAQQYKRISQLVTGGETHPEGLYAQARYALAAGLTGPARGHLNAMRAVLPQRRVYQMLADVEALAGDAVAQQDAKDKMASALPDPVWHCTACGQEHSEWQPVCGDCRAFGSVQWSPIERKAPVLLDKDKSEHEAEEDAEEPMLLTSEVEDQQ